MGLIKKIKLWWKTTPTMEKVLMTLTGVSTVASVAGAVYAVHEVKNMEVKVNLYPNGKDGDPIPLNGERMKEPRPIVYTSPEDAITCVPPDSPLINADTTSEKWEVWNPEWELKYPSKDGYEGTRLMDALDSLLEHGMDTVKAEELEEADARIEDLARQFAYLEGREDEFRERFSYLRNNPAEIYKNVMKEEIHIDVEEKGE